MRPADLAREHGLSAQAIRNYERDGILPPSVRSRHGYRQYTPAHAAALRTFLALVPAVGHRAGVDLMRALNDADVDAVLAKLDAAHAQLSRDRETLALVTRAISKLVPDTPETTTATLRVGELAAQLDVRPATLRQWEAAGILTPRREPGSGTAVVSRRRPARRSPGAPTAARRLPAEPNRGGHQSDPADTFPTAAQ